MAKQSSLFKLRGKADGQSFYYSKNGEYLTRKINPGMSSRVKTAKEYANTRLNNKEFGAAGACAGAMVSTVSKRWRYILNSIATGMLVKGIKEAMMQDTTHDWGKRSVLLANMPAIQDLYNRFSKNEVDQSIKDYIDTVVKYKVADQTLTANTDYDITSELANELQAVGADVVKVSVYGFTVHTPAIGADGETYLPAESILVKIDERKESATEGNTLIELADKQAYAGVQNSATVFGGLLVIVEPIKTINSKEYVLQQHCSAYWKSLETYSE